MSNVNSILQIPDRGGRRSGNVRRKVIIPGYQPERRSGRDRRSGQDRRSLELPEHFEYSRRNMDRFAEFSNTNRGLVYGILFSLTIWVVIILVLVRKGWF